MAGREPKESAYLLCTAWMDNTYNNAILSRYIVHLLFHLSVNRNGMKILLIKSDKWFYNRHWFSSDTVPVKAENSAAVIRCCATFLVICMRANRIMNLFFAADTLLTSCVHANT